MDDRFELKPGEMRIVGNEQLTCHDCALRYENAGRCEAYAKAKPLSILDGGDCEFKVVETA